MSRSHSTTPHRPNHDVPEEFEPGALPVDPDEGPAPAFIPGNPGDGRDTDPGAARDRSSLHLHRTIEVARCL